MCRNALESPLSSKLPPELDPTTRQQKAQGRCSPSLPLRCSSSSSSLLARVRSSLLLAIFFFFLLFFCCCRTLIVFVFFLFLVSCFLFSFFFITKKTKFSSSISGVIHDQAQQTSTLRAMNFFSHDPRNHEFVF